MKVDVGSEGGIDVKLSAFRVSIALVFGGIISIGVCFQNGSFKAFIGYKRGVRTVKSQTCVNTEEVKSLNFSKAFGCAGGPQVETSTSYTVPVTPVTMSYVTSRGGQALNLVASRNVPLEEGVVLQGSVSYEVYSSHPDNKPHISWKGLQKPKPNLWESGFDNSHVSNEISASLTPAGTHALTVLEDSPRGIIARDILSGSDNTSSLIASPSK